MTENSELRVLIVDDDVAVQRLLTRVLTQRGFACDTAGDGNEAEERVSRAHYDAVVTDLKMPNKHGHALAMHLLTLERPPVIVVHTGVIEPKLAKDLLARGVDDILFKPFDLGILAAKVEALVERRRAAVTPATGKSEPAPRTAEDSLPPLQDPPPAGGPVTLANIESRLASLSRILPISTAGLEVYNLTNTDQCGVAEITAAIQRDATLAVEVLRLGNSAFYNTTGKRIVQLERAVVQIGQKRVGELALATNALMALTSGMLPWLNIGLTWKRSMAAGLAVEMLIDEGRHQHIEEGLLLSAIMHPLGRIVLGTLYPNQYEQMVGQCSQKQDTLQDQERRVFPLNHTEVMAQLLASWNIPADVHLPLKHVLGDYSSLSPMSERTRIKVGLLRLAICLGDIAIGQWEEWDVVDVPPATLPRKLGIDAVSTIIEQTRHDVERLATFRTGRPEADSRASLPAPSRELAYCDLSGAPFDFLHGVVTSMGIKLVNYSADDLNVLDGNVLVNCLDTAPSRLAARARHAEQQHLLIVTETARAGKFAQYGQAIPLPASYGRLRSACWQASMPSRPTMELAGVS